MKASVAASGQLISSAANPLLKEVRRAVRQGTTTSDGCVVADSFHLLEEALRSGCQIQAVIASENARERVLRIIASFANRTTVRVVEDSLFGKIAPSETPQGVLALVRAPSWAMDDLFRSTPLVVVLDGVQDPGNAGAIIRSGEAFGATGALLLQESASPFNAKTLRASAGSLFRIPFIAGVDRDMTVKELRQRNVQIVAAASDSGTPPDRLDWNGPTALVIGSEAHGVSAPLKQGAKAVRIPTREVESLNASIAAAVLLYEASRQRAAGRVAEPSNVLAVTARARAETRAKGRA